MMPPRNLPRSPFAGIGAGHSILANLAREPSSPVRPSHQSNTCSTSTPRRLDGLPATDAAYNTSVAFSEHDFISSRVSDSLSRAFYFDVVSDQAAPSSSSSNALPRSVIASAFTAWLGDPVQDYDSDTFGDVRSSDDAQAVPSSSSGSSITAVSSSLAASSSSSTAHKLPTASKASEIDPARLFGRVQELIDTERSYVRRIDVLHQKYAIPLRTLAKDRDTAIIPLYEAQRLFGNIGEIAGANRAFLNDLERLASQGQDVLRAGLGDVLYNHMSCFSCYTEYFANFEKAKHIEQTLAKHRAFCEFADRAKYSVTGIGNTGLRDLLMEPIQRIPRYKLLIDAILAHVEPRDPLRTRLEQVITLISRIASCEADEKTRRAAVLWSFSRNVDSFPAELISAHRRFIDCIDVDDFPLDASTASSGIAASFSGLRPIHCTLFLFDDRIAIVKRANASTSGRKTVGLDDITRLTSQMKTFTEKSSHGALLPSSKRSELSFRGSISIMDVDAQDLGGTDLQLTLLRQPNHVSGDRWTGRPLRQYVAVDASSSTTSMHASRVQMGSGALDADLSAKLEKMRFLESVWRAKALFMSKRSRCEVRYKILPACRRRINSEDALLGMLQTNSSLQDARKIIYFHLHTRQSYAGETHKTPVAVSLNQNGVTDLPPLGHNDLAHPHAILDIIAVDEMEEDLAAQVRTKDAHGGEMLGQEHQLSSADLGEHIVQLSDEVDKRFGNSLRNYALSQPGTPSGSGFLQRAKAAAGLENFGRSLLFGASGAASSISSAGISNLDVFGSPTRRSNSNASKSTFSSNAASISSRGMTMSTAGTSISSRSGAFEAMSRAADSPRSFRRFSRHRSSSVGPPSSAASRCDADSADENEDGVLRRARALTPDPVSLLSTSAGASTSTTPRKVGTSTLVGGRAAGGHVRARTESAAPTTPSWSPSKAQLPFQQRQRAESVDLCRTPSSAGRRPTGPREQASPSPAPSSNARIEAPSPSWLANGPTTPLNIRRKPVPSSGRDSDNEQNDAVATPVTPRPASSIGVYGTAGSAPTQRHVSGTKRPLSTSDADVPNTDALREGSLSKRPSLGRDDVTFVSRPTGALPRSIPMARLSADEAKERPSVSESETSTERGHGDGTVNGAELVEGIASAKAPAPVTQARTSSTASKSQEARRRNEAMEHGLRLVKEEMNLLRCDVEILQSSMTAIENEAQTPRKRRGDDSVLKEMDFNSTASISAEVDNIHSRLKKLEFLFTDVDAKWISTIRMHNRIMHDLTNVSSALAAAQTSKSSSDPSQAEAHASLLEKEKLEIQVSALKRKCELLTMLEADGRLENTEIHKAFNEELDMLYDHTQTPESEELVILRRELRRTKADQHQLMVENKRLKRDLSIEQAETETYRAALTKHGLQ